MFRVLILSLCLTFLAPAALIEDSQTAPVTLAEAPPFELNLSYFLNLVLSYTFPDIDDPDVQANVLTVITPAYEAFLNFLLNGANNGLGPGFDTPATLTAAAAVELLAVDVITRNDPLSVNTSVPEPSTWWLMAASGAVWLLKRRR